MTALAALALLAAPVCVVVLWRAWRLPPACKLAHPTQDAARDAARDAYDDQVRLLHDMHLAVLRSAYDAEDERRREYRADAEAYRRAFADRAAEYDCAIRDVPDMAQEYLDSLDD